MNWKCDKVLPATLKIIVVPVDRPSELKHPDWIGNTGLANFVNINWRNKPLIYTWEHIIL